MTKVCDFAVHICCWQQNHSSNSTTKCDMFVLVISSRFVLLVVFLFFLDCTNYVCKGVGNYISSFARSYMCLGFKNKSNLHAMWPFTHENITANSEAFGHLCYQMLHFSTWPALQYLGYLCKYIFLDPNLPIFPFEISPFHSLRSQGANVRHEHCFLDEDAMLWLKRCMACKRLQSFDFLMSIFKNHSD